MGTWGYKTFENDGAADWLYDLEQAASAAFLLKPLEAILKSRGEADLDDCLEGLGAAEVIAGARYEPMRNIPAIARKWVKRVGFSPDNDAVKLALAVIPKVRDDSELAGEWKAEGKHAYWAKELKALAGRLKEALRKPAPRRVVKKVEPGQTLAEFILEVAGKKVPAQREELRQRLLKLANPNRAVGGKGLNSLTPLHWVASSGLLEEARLLIERGADIDAEISGMARPIGFAIENNQSAMIKLLLEAGADSDYAFQEACKSNRPKLVELVHASGGSLRSKDEMGRTVIHHAAFSGAAKSIPTLAGLGANVNDLDHSRETPLHYAAMFNHLGAVKALVELGAKANARNKDGKTASDLAAEDGYSAIVRFLKLP